MSPTERRQRSTESARIRSVLFALVIGVAVSAIAYSQLHDPGEGHYMRAREMVDAFELGKEPANIDYGHPVYEEALSELALVPPGSDFAEPAAALSAQIRSRIDAMHRHQEETRARHLRKLEKARERREIMFENQRRAALIPDDPENDPECVHEEDHEEPTR